MEGQEPEQPRKEYLDNQVHGGAIVNENVRAVYQAIRRGEPAEAEVQILLMSLPTDDMDIVKPQIDTVYSKYTSQIKILEADPRLLTGSPLSQKNKVNIELLHKLQNQSLELTQKVVTYLDSIGQYWQKRNLMPVSIKTYEQELEEEKEKHE